jgi:hypothetical protein
MIYEFSCGKICKFQLSNGFKKNTRIQCFLYDTKKDRTDFEDILTLMDILSICLYTSYCVQMSRLNVKDVKYV